MTSQRAHHWCTRNLGTKDEQRMKLLNSMMSRFVKIGTMRVIDADGNEHVYSGEPGPEVTLRITDPKLYTSLFLNPELREEEINAHSRPMITSEEPGHSE